MAWSDYWGALSARQRVGLGVGAVLIVVATIGIAVWTLRDPYVPLASDMEAERLNELALQLEGAGVSYRLTESGDGIAVPQSQAGKARASVAAGALDAPANVGLELFKETDYSSTDFAQRVNYQRALQGELTRTIQTIAGVRSARVHVILAERGLFKRGGARATAAVSVTLQPSRTLSRSQVIGIQRLVASAVPEIKTDDVVVLDESGASLTRVADGSVGDLTSVQLDLKRQADQYLQEKVFHLLQELAPRGIVSVAVDTTLDEKQARITTEEPIAVRGAKNSGQAAGVLVKERQSQRGRAAGMMQTDGYAPESDATDWEYEYKVGNRIEQTLSAPGSIKRVSVAVALQGAATDLSSAVVEQLVAHAVGVDRSRGDSVSVLMLPAVADRAGVERVDSSPATMPFTRRPDEITPSAPAQAETAFSQDSLAILLAVALAALIATAVWWAHRLKTMRDSAPDDVDEEAVAAKVRQWLGEEASDGRR